MSCSDWKFRQKTWYALKIMGDHTIFFISRANSFFSIRNWQNPGKRPLRNLGIGISVLASASESACEYNYSLLVKLISVKRLGLTIDDKLNFGIHINNICKVASAKIKGLGRIRNRLNLSQAKILYNSFILSQFNYCYLVWMFCSKTQQNKINQIQKKSSPYSI